MARWRRSTAVFATFAFFACDPSFSPPPHPPHEKKEDGALHAMRLKDPFSCGTSARSEAGVACDTDGARPPDDLLSCDALGCHGNFDYTLDTSMSRALTGSEGPGCYTCHDDRWTKKKKEGR
jgi:hypothetical protein